MISDRELDKRLARYRPASPAADLRSRIVAPAASRGSWLWSAAAAALLLVTGAVQMSTARIYRNLEHTIAPAASSMLAQLPALDDALGDDQLLRSTVEQLVRYEREAAEAASASSNDAGASWQ